METVQHKRRRTTKSQDLFNDLVHQLLGGDVSAQEAALLFSQGRARLVAVDKADVDPATRRRYIELRFSFAVE